MIKRIWIDDWTANWFGKRSIKLEECDEKLVTIVKSLDEDLPYGLRLKIRGRYNYGLSIENENYHLTLEVLPKSFFSKPIYKYDIFLKRDLTIYYRDSFNPPEVCASIRKDFKTKTGSHIGPCG